MADLKNEFTWSVSRDGMFQDCKRQYWWNYYGSWGGWGWDATDEARQAYMLKKLSNRWAWVGTVVHETIETALGRVSSAAREQKAAWQRDELEPLLESVTGRMRRDFGGSRSKRYHSRPAKILGLAEHEYGEDVPSEEWAKTNRNALTALRTFFTSDLFGRIRESDPSRWLPIEQLEQFDFEGTGVWAVLDFATRRPDDGIEIYDWKTGAVNPAANRPQLGCYTLYVEQRFGVGPENVENHLIYLGEELEEVTFVLDAEELEATRAKMRASIGEMRALIRDPAKNIADVSDFPMTDDLAKCERCRFRRLCERDN